MKTIAAFIFATAAAWAADQAQLAGRWDATVTIRGTAIPFRLDFGDSANFTGQLYNGDVPVTPSSASFADGLVTLRFAQFPLTIAARLNGGALEGKIEGRAADRVGSPFSAHRHVETAAASTAPAIGGVWEIPHESAKGEKAWRFIVRQSGSEVVAAILRVDGDTGALTGSWTQGKFTLSHFDGTRPSLMEITPNADGTLAVEMKTGRDGKMTAYRIEEAGAKGLPAPADFANHTTVRDPNEVFTFRFPDLNGNVWSNEDPKFRGKALLVTITGTWCPNCHDEAPYLEALYREYRDRGVEIVALDFEEAEQQGDFERARAFLKKYRIDYTYLIAGAPDELHEKITQAVNLNTWPATFFVGRDGRVKAVHAGFAGPASGEFYTKLDREYHSTIDALLREDTASEPAQQRGQK
jgi:thiol-disulfide isomerase/thioredoxin